MTVVNSLLVVLVSVAILGQGLYLLLRPRAVMRLWRKSMNHIPLWPAPSTSDRVLMTYIIVWGLISTCAGAVLVLSLFFEIPSALAHHA